MRKLLLLSTALTALAGCNLSPDYKLANMFESESFKEANVAPTPDAPVLEETQTPVTDEDNITWKRVDQKAKIEEVAWWKMLHLPELDALEELAMKDNPSLEVAAQRVNAARGQAEIAGSDLYPAIGLSGGPQRIQVANAPLNANLPAGFNVTAKPYTLYTAQGTISYTLDLFGKNRNTARAADRDLDAEQNNYRAARLTLQADLAEAYIEHASLLAENDILNRTVTARRQTRDHNKAKYDIGSIDELTYSNYETELSNAEADRAAVAQQLLMNEHRLATLLGIEPSKLTLSQTTLNAAPPKLPENIPVKLLERRPDVQAAVSNVAAANARVGAARAGYFPDISFAAVGGYSSIKSGDLFKKAGQFWSLGGANGLQMLTQPIFQGGELEGTLEARKANFEAASASYRGTALNAFREVEDSLSNIRHLKEQAAARTKGAEAAKRAYTAAGQRYNIGYSSQLEYLDAERNYLATQRASVQVIGQRYVATIQLVKALGGTWQTGAATPVKVPTVVPTPAAKTESQKPALPAEPVKPVDAASPLMPAAPKVSEPSPAVEKPATPVEVKKPEAVEKPAGAAIVKPEPKSDEPLPEEKPPTPGMPAPETDTRG